jgi:predicted  nucleic acid-binding Zn-ribbon protein
MTFLLKACPRCGGDLFPDASESEATLFACLQCGFVPHPRLQPAAAVPDAMRNRRREARIRHAAPADRAAV